MAAEAFGRHEAMAQEEELQEFYDLYAELLSQASLMERSNEEGTARRVLATEALSALTRVPSILVKMDQEKSAYMPFKDITVFAIRAQIFKADTLMNSAVDASIEECAGIITCSNIVSMAVGRYKMVSHARFVTFLREETRDFIESIRVARRSTAKLPASDEAKRLAFSTRFRYELWRRAQSRMQERAIREAIEKARGPVRLLVSFPLPVGHFSPAAAVVSPARVRSPSSEETLEDWISKEGKEAIEALDAVIKETDDEGGVVYGSERPRAVEDDGAEA